jgi:hypothetical protein
MLDRTALSPLDQNKISKKEEQKLMDFSRFCNQNQILIHN